MKQNPFSLYDFLGYVFPGLFLIFAIFIIHTCKSSTIISYCEVVDSIPTFTFEGYVFILLLSYSIGHLLSFISSITIEKFGVWKYGYPSRSLLGDKSIPKFREHFVTFQGWFWGIILIISLLPLVLLDYFFGKWLGFKTFFHRPLDDFLTKIIVLKTNQLAAKLGLNPKHGFQRGDANNKDFFRIIQHYTYDHSQKHQSKFMNYVALYGFLRTMTLIMMFLFWYPIIHAIIIGRWENYIATVCTFAALIAYVFFMAFMKFYRRYTLEGFMVLVIDDYINGIK